MKLRRLITYRRVLPMVMDYCYDFWRFARFSSAFGPWSDAEKLRASITSTYHNIEKGLSLRNPRPGFGRPNVEKLLALLRAYIDRYGTADHLVTPVGVLHAYSKKQAAAGVDVSWLERSLASINESVPLSLCDGRGGVISRTRDEVLSQVDLGGLSMLTSRSSCRQYSDKQVEPHMIEAAVRVAQRSPVVCNRQSGRVYKFAVRSDISMLLDLHGGARGFASEVPVLLCVTADLRNFNSSAERYQGWIDGGLFAMSLIFGLHAQGLATCCLNWSREAAPDAQMRRLLGLNPAENIIMFIAVGHYEESFNVAASERKPVREVLFDKDLVS